MTLNALTLIHVALRQIAIDAGFAVVCGLLVSNPPSLRRGAVPCHIGCNRRDWVLFPVSRFHARAQAVGFLPIDPYADGRSRTLSP